MPGGILAAEVTLPALLGENFLTPMSDAHPDVVRQLFKLLPQLKFVAVLAYSKGLVP